MKEGSNPEGKKKGKKKVKRHESKEEGSRGLRGAAAKTRGEGLGCLLGSPGDKTKNRRGGRGKTGWARKKERKKNSSRREEESAVEGEY